MITDEAFLADLELRRGTSGSELKFTAEQPWAPLHHTAAQINDAKWFAGELIGAKTMLVDMARCASTPSTIALPGVHNRHSEYVVVTSVWRRRNGSPRTRLHPRVSAVVEAPSSATVLPIAVPLKYKCVRRGNEAGEQRCARMR